MMDMTNNEREAILVISRRMFIEHSQCSAIRERAAINGAYDMGTDIQQYADAAMREYLVRRDEALEEGL